MHPIVTFSLDQFEIVKICFPFMVCAVRLEIEIIFRKISCSSERYCCSQSKHVGFKGRQPQSTWRVNTTIETNFAH